MLSLLLSALLLQPASPSPPTSQPAPACAATDQALPASLAPWRSPAPAGAVVRPGIAVSVPPTAPLTVEIAEAGTYGVAIDQGAWIDMAHDGTVLHSVNHGHGPACSTIRKIVDFALEPGRYTLTLSRTEAPAIRLLVVRR
jgi:hypothetical protein